MENENTGMPSSTTAEASAKRKVDWFAKNMPAEKQGALRGQASTEADSLHAMVIEHLQQDMFFTPDQHKDWRDYAAYALARIADPAMRHMCRLAHSGDELALKALAAIAIDATQSLHRASQKFPVKAKRIARNEIAWPVMKSKCLAFDGSQRPLSIGDQVLLNGLELGKDNPVQARRWGVKSDFPTKVISMLVEQVRSSNANPFPKRHEWQQRAIELKGVEMSLKNADRWWSVFLARITHEFPNDEALVKRWLKFGGKIGGSKNNNGNGTRASYIRQQLKKKFKEMLGVHSLSRSRKAELGLGSQVAKRKSVKSGDFEKAWEGSLQAVRTNNPQGFFS